MIYWFLSVYWIALSNLVIQFVSIIDDAQVIILFQVDSDHAIVTGCRVHYIEKT